SRAADLGHRPRGTQREASVSRAPRRYGVDQPAPYLLAKGTDAALCGAHGSRARRNVPQRPQGDPPRAEWALRDDADDPAPHRVRRHQIRGRDRPDSARAVARPPLARPIHSRTDDLDAVRGEGRAATPLYGGEMMRPNAVLLIAVCAFATRA